MSPDALVLVDFQTSKAVVRPIVQRRAGTEYADVPVLFTYTGLMPTNVQARVVASVGGAVVKDWTDLSSTSFAAPNGLGYLDSVPQGADYLLQIRDGLNPTNDATISNGAVPWGVGVVVLFMGQSNAVVTLGAGSYTDIVPGTALTEYAFYNDGHVCGSIFDSAGWHAPSNGSNGPTGINTAVGGVMYFMRRVAEALETTHGKKVPVGLIPHAFGATSISQYFPDGDMFSPLLVGSGSAAGSIGFASPKNIWAGDFEGVVWHQGEANCGDTRAHYLADLKTLYQGFLDYVAPFGRSASSLFFLPAVLGSYGVGSCASIENIRGAVLDLESFAASNGWPRVKAGWNCIDLDATLNDGLHFTGAFAKSSMRRAIQSVLKQIGCSTFSGAGPRITGLSRSGDVATLTVTRDGGSALVTPTASAPSGFLANTQADFNGPAITVTAAIVGAAIQVTFPGGTTYPAYLKYMGGKIGTASSCSPDITNPIYDNAAYPTGATGTDVEARGLPLMPTADALVVS